MTPNPARLALAAFALGAVALSTPISAQTAAEPSQGNEGAEAEAPAAAGPDLTADEALATVNGVTLTLGELISLRGDLPAQYQQLPDEVLRDGLIQQMIDQALMAQAAREAGLDEQRAIALSIVNQTRAVLANAWLTNELNSRMTPEAIREVYDERVAGLEPEKEIRAAHILVDDEALATEIKSKIDGGEDFATLAAEHGTDGTATRGGDLGWFVHGDMVPQFADAAFALEPGTVGGPVRSPFGWHLIKVDEARDRPVPTFDEMAPGIAEEMSQQLQVSIVEELRAGAEIDRSTVDIPPAVIRADELLEEE